MRPTRLSRLTGELLGVLAATMACGTSDPPSVASAYTGGVPASGGTSASTGGALASGGAPVQATGGSPGSGGTPAAGGSSPAGRVPTTGGAQATGGATTGGAGGSGGGLEPTGGVGSDAVGGMAGVETGGAGPTGGTGTGGVLCPDAACGNTTRENERCSDADWVGVGKYGILNNLWGATDTVESDGQCTWTLCDTQGEIAWGTEFTWTSGDEISVKSFAAAILGWHWGDMPGGTGLPIQLSEERKIPCSWSFSLSVDQAASLNVAWDLWLNPSPDVSLYTQPTDEIMVWVHRQNKEDPIGYEDGLQNTVAVGDATWDLYRGNNGGNDVYSYLRVGNASCATVDLMDFLKDLVARGWVDPSKYLISIEAGPEVVRGQGQLVTETYSCDVQ